MEPINSTKVLLVGLGRVGWAYDYDRNTSTTFLGHYKSILEIAKKEMRPIELSFFDNNINARSRFLALTGEDSSRLLNSETEFYDDKWDLIILAVNTENLISTLSPILKQIGRAHV